MGGDAKTYRIVDEKGNTSEVDESKLAGALSSGFHVEGAGEEAQRLAEDVRHDEYGGALGGVKSFASNAISGATLGLSDVAAGALGRGDELEALREEHPYAAAGGQIAGGIASGFAGEGSLLARTPAGYLARYAGKGIEAARAVGGVEGALGVVGISGVEGAIQNGGMYLSDTALGDRDLTAEGMAGALGSGFTFGAVAGGAAYGMERGTIAARRMFARTAEGGERAAGDAANAFDRKTEEVLQAHDDTAAIARKRLDEIRAMKADAMQTRNYAQSEIADARLAEFRNPSPPDLPSPPGPLAPEGTQLPSKAGPAGETRESQTSSAPLPKTEASTRLERQLAEMKTKIEGGATLQELNAARSPVVNTEALLGPDVAAEEQKLTEALGEYEGKRTKVDSWLDRVKNPRKSIETNATEFGAGQSNLPRARRTSALDEDVFVEQSGGQLRTIGRAEHDLGDLTPNSRILARSNGESFSHGAVLDDAYNDAIERASLAESPAAQESALHEAADIEQQIHRYVRSTKPENGAVIDQIEKTRAQAGRTGYHAAFTRAERRAMDEAEATSGIGWAKGDKSRPHVAVDAHEASQVLGDYEKSAAKLTEAVGDNAAPAAKDAADGFRAAEETADRKAMDRTSRAVDDHVDAQQYGPEFKTPKERIADAKQQKLEADAHIARLKIQETDVKKSIPPASKRPARGEPQLKKEVQEPARPPSRFERTKAVVEKVGTVAELAGMAGIPGIPKPSDIPVVGPLVGMYLKMRALTGKLAGRVPATAEARAASLASRTKERAALAVDRMLGLAARAAPAARTVAVRAGVVGADALEKRLFDDGQPDAPKDANIQQLAIVRAREVTTAAQNPQQIIARVRQQLRDVTDPDLIAAAEKQQVAMYQHLADKAPKVAPDNVIPGPPQMPSKSDAQRFACRVAVANDPLVAFHQVENQHITPEAADTLRAVYPKLFQMVQQRLLERVGDVTEAIPYQQRVRMSLLYDVPLDRSLDPATIASLQAAHAVKSPAAPTQQSSPPMPSMAGAPNLTALYQTAADRRSARR